MTLTQRIDSFFVGHSCRLQSVCAERRYFNSTANLLELIIITFLVGACLLVCFFVALLAPAIFINIDYV